jgi:outer membrane biogenesis lipoprotein LolB
METQRVLTVALAIAASLLLAACKAATQMGANTPAFINQTSMQDQIRPN